MIDLVMSADLAWSPPPYCTGSSSMPGAFGLHPLHEPVAAVDAGLAGLVVHDQRDLALAADQLGQVLGRLGRGGLVVGRGRGQRDVALDAGVERDDRDVLRLRLLHQRRARLASPARRSRARPGFFSIALVSIVTCCLDVLLGRRALEGDPRALGLGLLLGALLDRLPELVLEALGDDRDVRLLAAATAAAAADEPSPLVVRAARADGQGERRGDDRQSCEPLGPTIDALLRFEVLRPCACAPCRRRRRPGSRSRGSRSATPAGST